MLFLDRNFVQNFTESVRPKWRFAKSIPGQDDVVAVRLHEAEPARREEGVPLAS
jgi:hypothetical protein